MTTRPGRLVVRRLDQGVDVQGTPGDFIRAPARSRVNAVKSDPGGFGRTVYFTELDGPNAGQQLYVGHAAPTVHAGQVVKPGSPLVRLLKKPLGNATQPGWAEIGFAQGGAPAGEQTAPSALQWVKTRLLSTGKTGGGRRLSFAQLTQLWVQAGGPRNRAAVAAAIALAESTGDPTKHNDDPGTGDDSWGLWQINYYGELRVPRTRLFGPPEGMLDPLTNARAAVTLYTRRGNFEDWSTYKHGDFIDPLRKHVKNADHVALESAGPVIDMTPVIPVTAGAAAGAVRAGVRGFRRWRPGGIAAGAGAAGLLSGAIDTAGFLGAALWLVDARNWLRLVEFVTGSILMLFGLIGLAVTLFSRSDTGQSVATAASVLPGSPGNVARGVAAVGNPKRAARRETRDYVRLRTTPSPDQRRAEIRERTRQLELDRQARDDERRKVRAAASDARVARRRAQLGRTGTDDEIPF